MEKSIVQFMKSPDKRLWGKKGAGLIQGLVMGVAGLVIIVILAFLVVSTLKDAGLVTTGSNESTAVNDLAENFTSGVNEVSEKIPTVLKIAAIVLILGVLVFLWAQYKRMNIGGGSEL